MPAPATIDDFLDVVRKSEQIDNDQLESFMRKYASEQMPAEPRKLAALMVRDGLLTTFQSEQLLLGKHKGFTLAGYRILERLGTGGTGTVYLAEHQVMMRRVALKVLPPTYANDPSVLERFRREAQAVARLDHPNIVRAYDFRQEGTLHLLVMEYVNGPNLQEVMQQQGALPIPLACDYIRQAAIGLQNAHEAGLVHRDIKPANLLVDASGTVKVLDLGLARFAPNGAESVTQKFDENMVMGTADYLAPEQAISLHNVDARADIYSLGATFYALLVGEPPFHEGTITQKLLWHQMRSPRPLRERRPDVPVELANIVEAMMAKTPEERVQSGSDVAALVAPWCTNGAALQGATTPAPNGKGHHVRTGGPGSGKRQMTVIPPEDALTTESGRLRAHRRSQESLVEKPRIVKDATATGLLSVAILGAVMGGILLLVGGVIAFLVMHSPKPDTEIKVDPDRDRPAIVSMKPLIIADNPANVWHAGALAQLPSKIGEVARMPDGKDGSLDVAFAPDGKRLATAGVDRLIRVWDVLKGPNPVPTLAGNGNALTHVAFNAKGTELLSSCRDGAVRLWDLGKMKKIRDFGPHPKGKAVQCAVFSPDERQVLTGCDDALVRLFETKSGKLLKEMKGHTKPISSVAFRPVDKNKRRNQALSASADGTLRLWNLDDGKQVKLLKGHTKGVLCVAFLPDGKAVSSGQDNQVLLWNVDQEKIEYKFSHPIGVVGRLAVSRDGRGLLLGGKDGKIVYLDVKSRKQQQPIFVGHTKAVTGLAFTPDGKYFASCSEDATIRIWGLPPLK